jgi:hypothetical protein
VGSAAWFVALRGDEENGRRLLCPSATPSATELLETAAAKIGGRMERGPVLTCSLGLSVDSLEVLVGQLEQRPGHCDRAWRRCFQVNLLVRLTSAYFLLVRCVCFSSCGQRCIRLHGCAR